MSLIRPNFSPSHRDLRVFSVLWLLFFGAFGALAWHRGAPFSAWIFWLIGTGAAGPGLVFPLWLRPVYLAAIYVSLPLGILSSCLLLGLVYYFILTPIGLLLRWSGHDPLTRKFQPGNRTYWKTRAAPPPPHSYFHQH